MTPGPPAPCCRPCCPGCIARRHYDQLVGDDREPFTEIGDLDQFLVATAFERITEIASEVPRFRLRSVLDSTWTRLRAHAATHRRDWDTLVPLGEDTDRAARPERTAAEELTGTLIDAVERRDLRPVDAGLVYATRVAGHTTADVASTLAWRTPSLLRRRHRVEQLLAAQILGQPPRGFYVAAAKDLRPMAAGESRSGNGSGGGLFLVVAVGALGIV